MAKGRKKKNEINRRINLNITTKDLSDKIDEEVGEGGNMTEVINKRLINDYKNYPNGK